MQPTPDDPSEPTFAVETEERLSRSLLFRLQRRFYDRAGIGAWSDTTVPHYVTNNPALAHAYAETLLGFLRDCAAAQRDPAEPVTLVELGAGSGRFAYLVLRSLVALHRRSPVSGLRFRYVMTDFTESNLAYWRAHDALRPFVEAGLLDFGVFDADRDGEIALLHAGQTLSPGSLEGPLGVVANYVFDSLGQDAFWFEGGQLHEYLISLASGVPSPDLSDPGQIGRLASTYTRRPAPLDYYGEPAFDAILRGYAGTVEGATVLFPCAALRCLERLAKLSTGGLFLLSGDRGGIDRDAVADPDAPSITVHGSFSMNVNYHAIAEYVLGRGGQALRMAHRHENLNVSGFLLGAHPAAWAETQHAFASALGEAGGPDDFFSLRRGIQEHYEELELGPVLSLIRLSRWDPRILRDCLPALWKHVQGCSDASRREVVATVMRVWEQYYFIREEEDLAFELALLAHAYQGFREALALFQGSIRLHGDSPRTRWNMGLCHYALGEMDAALGCFAEARRLDPTFVPARAVQVKGDG